MKLKSFSKDGVVLTYTSIVGFGLFFGGLFDVLDHIIIKSFLFISFGILFIIATVYALKNATKQNRPEDISPQDDSL